ncbi:extracellular catalytic domain type 1 short-chain-length polyhydroxyalkanoate depolymerase [Haloarcula salinisoli]|uniref:PHB depolymerase family esterase n=1 Tax=Haloarcula salinisoli TaxID=2487746 RepID=A0A8J7YBF6_9EURY|nr:PHB depolymerase family esterase [Halomicroarcula salinisoli]MBX0302955.1 PHB depolymerase family esterase [Halomicroarcula salinisoli]
MRTESTTELPGEHDGTPAVEPLVSALPEEHSVHRTTAGEELEYKTFVPTGYDESEAVPLVVMLHGCLQTPADFARGTRMNEIAERETFIVVYPAQSRRRNFQLCWTWFEDDDTSRGEGEAAILADLTEQLTTEFAIDDERVFVAGLSAGASMASNLVVAYPDTFAAAGIHSGLGYDAAESVDEATAVMDDPSQYDPQAKGTAAHEAMGDLSRVVPTIVVHGSADRIVDPEHGSHAAEQATQMNDLADNGTDDDSIEYVPDRLVRGTSEGGALSRQFTRAEFHDGHERPVVVEYVVEGMGHAWSGGNPGGSFVDAFGPNASELFWAFFASHGTARRPVADATSVVTDVGESIPFYGRGSYDPDGSVVRYEWEFGDGETATGHTVSHAYGEPGEYTVTLTVHDDSGATATDTRTVHIEGQS